MSFVLYERRESFAVIRLNRPDKLNALSRELLASLSTTFESAQSDREIRAIILTGAGRAFSAGTDLTELQEANAGDARAISQGGQSLCEQIESCRVPVVAAVNGIAAGGGCELALACHLRIASTSAEFSLPETKLGVIPGYGGTQRLTREIGRGHALDVMLTGRKVGAQEALRIGLINRLAPEPDLMPQAELFAREIVVLAPLAIQACLKAVTRGADLSLEEGLELETEIFASLFSTKDMREGTRAFLEKRKPVFRGK